MSIRNLIILSQLNPPSQRRNVLNRVRVNDSLRQSVNYSLTILEAGTGYGKSTALLSFLNELKHPVYWFTISGSDRDPKLFLAKLFSAFTQRSATAGEEALRILDMPESTTQEALIAFVNDLSRKIDEDTLFVLDDFHRVRDIPEVMGSMDWLIENLPSHLHLLIATRHNLEFKNINKWRLKGRLLEIKKDQLIFTGEEIDALFQTHYGITLTEKDIETLLHLTEGWAIGLQMVWQTLQSNPSMNIDQVVEENRPSRMALFQYLADEVFEGLDETRQNFLRDTSILSKLDSSTCDFLLNIENSDKILPKLHNAGLFIEELRPGVYRYHQMFREFLNNRLQHQPERAKLLHRKIASYFQAHEYWEEAIYHLISAQDYHQINQVLENIGNKLINEGRHESINYWIHEIPEDIRKNYPHIQLLLGEVNRYLGHFEEALEHYHVAERLYRNEDNRWGISMALKGQGQVFLDTIRPINADQLLQDALKLLDPKEMKDEVADLLVLTAENQLNLGYPDSAEKLLSQASGLRSQFDRETDLIQARVFLRTGRLQQGIELLKSRESKTQTLPTSRPQRFHRESPLLLSLFYSIIGEVDKAEYYAKQGIEYSRLLQSTFVQSVGNMRLGHAILLQSQHPFNNHGFEQAIINFRESIERIDVVRIHVEPLWGMCRAFGYTGQLSEAQGLAEESLAIAEKAGDEWISVLINLSIGAGAVLVEDFDTAQLYLTSAEVSSLKVKDTFTLCVARLWLALKAYKQKFYNTAYSYLEKMLPLINPHGYEFLLQKETLMGLKDPEMIYPLLIDALKNNIEPAIVKDLIKSRGLEEASFHPGYTLWVQTFGKFRVWRGDNLIAAQDWKREKSLQLFQLLVANRDKWLHRDQINAILWPENPVDDTSNYLKVIFNTLNQILEPERPRGAVTFFVERQQERYRLNPVARIIVDADLFVNEIEKGTESAFERAINLYEGSYFENCYVQEWLTIEEQYYRQNFLTNADNLVNLKINSGDYETALDLTYKILTVDQLWEPAYRAQMRIFNEMGESAMVREVFTKCEEVLSSQIGSEVSSETQQLYETLKNG